MRPSAILGGYPRRTTLLGAIAGRIARVGAGASAVPPEHRVLRLAELLLRLVEQATGPHVLGGQDREPQEDRRPARSRQDQHRDADQDHDEPDDGDGDALAVAADEATDGL